MRLELTYDLDCIWCFLDLSRLHYARANVPGTAVDLTLWPFQLAPDRPTEGVDNHQSFVNHFGAERVQQVYKEIEMLARDEERDIDCRKITILPNTLLAHKLTEMAPQGWPRLRLAMSLMEAHFSKGLNIGDAATLAKIAEAHDIDHAQVTAYINSSIADAKMTQAHLRSVRLGITGVPHKVIDGHAHSGALSRAQWIALFQAAA